MSLLDDAHKMSFQLAELTILFSKVSSFQTIAHQVLEIEIGLAALTHGFLTSEILPYRQTESIVNYIAAHLADSDYLYLVSYDPLALY
jgi:hypothetical protein